MLSQLIDGLKAIVVGHNVDERRTTARARCELAVSCRSQKGGFPANLRDLSISGVGLGADAFISRGTKLKIACPRAFGSGTDAMGVVRWCRRVEDAWYHLGVDLQGMSPKCWVPAALRELGLDPDAPRQRRKLMRVPAALGVELKLADSQAAEGKLLNLSVGGAFIETRARLSRHAQVVMLMGPWDGIPAITLTSSVVSVKNEQGLWRASLRFTHIGSDQRKLLGRYLTGLVKAAKA
ncbi:MAG: PilZ domain-containing protein [Vulcanimicrobiota bacterium]